MKHLLIQGLAVNRSKIQRVTEPGPGGKDRKYIVLKDTLALRKNSVMNGLFYSDEFVTNHYMELNDKFAPEGHPVDENGNLIPSTNPIATNEFHIGAFNRNPRLSGDDVLVDIYIDESVAANSERGRAVLSRVEDIEAGNNAYLATSTGLFFSSDNKPGVAANGAQYAGTIVNGAFEHNALLLNELPAGGDTGFTANSEQVEVARIDDCQDNRSQPGIFGKLTKLVFGGNEMSHEQIRDAIRSALNPSDDEPYVYPEAIFNDSVVYHDGGKLKKRTYNFDNGTISLGEPVDVEIEFKQITANKEQESEMDEAKLKELMANELKPLTGLVEAVAALANDVKVIKSDIAANADKEAAEMRKAVQAKFGMTEEAVSGITGNALQELYAKTQDSAPVGGGEFGANSDKDNLQSMEAPE